METDPFMATYREAQQMQAVRDVQATLAERGARYGDFGTHAVLAQTLQDAMRDPAYGWARLDATKRQALTVIADKLARILCGDPNYADNWHDLQGYAKLVEDRLLPTRTSGTILVGSRAGP